MIEVSGTHSNQSLHKRATAGGVLMSRFASVAIIAAALVAPATMAQSADNGSQEQSEAAASAPIKIGFVNTQRILRDSEPAKEAQAMIEEEFNQRNERLQEESQTFVRKYSNSRKTPLC